MIRKILFVAFLSILVLGLKAQNNVLGGGEVHGSFQADAQHYQKDSAIGADEIPEKMAVNAFLEMRYTNKGFEAGMRYELFMPPIQGYDSRWKGNGFGYRYLRYSNERVDVTAGNFYEQFGSGMILRGYQEWNLGFDNSFDGVRVKYKMKALSITGLVAKQRLYWELGPGLVRGVDGQLSLNDFIRKINSSKTRVFLGLSFVSRYQVDQNPIYNLPENVGAYAGRFQLFRGGFNFKMEMAKKINDPNATNNFIYKEGNAVMAEIGYSQKGLGFTLQLNRSDNMDFRSSRTATGFDSQLGYIPAMTRQHAYTLAAFYPYASQANGQMGLQATLIYKFDLASDLRLTIQQASRNSKIGGAWSKGHPDLVIYEMRGRYGALFLELKAVTPYKKNGELKKNEHLKTQDWFHGELRKRGYKVEFSTGLEESIKKIEDYLKIK